MQSNLPFSDLKWLSLIPQWKKEEFCLFKTDNRSSEFYDESGLRDISVKQMAL